MYRSKQQERNVAIQFPSSIYVEDIDKSIRTLRKIAGRDLRELGSYITEQLNGEKELYVEMPSNADAPKLVKRRDGWKSLVPCTLCLATNCLVDECEIIVKLHVSKNSRGSQPYQGKLSFWAEHEATGQSYRLERPPYVENFDECRTLAALVLEDVSGNEVSEMIRFELMTMDKPVIMLCGGGISYSLRLIQPEDEKENVRIDCSPLLNSDKCPRQYRVLSYAAYNNTENLRALADLAQPENTPCGWANRLEDGKHVDRDNLDGLRYYLMNVVARLYDDEQVAKGSALIRYDNDTKLCFCTGLVGRATGRYIYGVCGNKDANGVFHSVVWVENDFCDNERNSLLPPEIDNKNHGLPFPANWTREPDALICQYSKIGKFEDNTNWTHILYDHRERLSTLGFCNVSPEDPAWEPAAKQAIIKAVYEARKRVQGNYRYVMPGFYNGRISLQLPLCIAGRGVPDAYLVLIDQGPNKPYFSPTLLTPMMAYNNARAITPQERSAWEYLFHEIQMDLDIECSAKEYMGDSLPPE